MNGEGLVLFTMSHEIVHMIREGSPEDYKALADFLISKYAEKGIDVDDLVRLKQEEYGTPKYLALKEMGKSTNLTYDEALEEVIADSCESFLLDLADAKRGAEISQQLKKENPTLWERIKDALYNILQRVRNAYRLAKPQSREAQIIAQMKDIIEPAYEIYARGYTNAARNLRNMEGGRQSGTKFDMRELQNETQAEQIERLKAAKVEYVVANPETLSEISEVDVSHVKAQVASEVLFPLLEKFGIFGTHYNGILDIDFEYSRTAGKRSFSHQITISQEDYRAQAIIQTNLKQLCKTAYPVEVHTDEKPTSESAKLEGVITLYNAIQAGKDAVFVKMTVKIPAREANRLHMVVASKIEKGLDLALIAEATKSHSAGKSNPTIKITQILEYVKDNEEFTKRLPVKELLSNATDIKNQSRTDYITDDKAARWTDKRIDDLYDDYASSSLNYSKAYAAYISPEEFLSLTATNPEKIIRESKELDAEELADYRQPIYLAYDPDSLSSRVVGHEGRHRMAALMAAGIKKVPIAIQFYGETGKYDRQPIDVLHLRGQAFSSGKAKGNIMLRDLVPISKAYRAEIEKKFGANGKEGVKFSRRSTQLDSEYLSAVERGDMETAQRMVDEAAKAAGYNTPILYHGTQKFGFTEFDLNKMDDKMSIFLTSTEETASTYSGKTGVKRINEKLSGDKYIDAMSPKQLVEALNKNKGPSQFDTEYKVLSSDEINDMVDSTNAVLKSLKKYAKKVKSKYAVNADTNEDAYYVDYNIHELVKYIDENNYIWIASHLKMLSEQAEEFDKPEYEQLYDTLHLLGSILDYAGDATNGYVYYTDVGDGMFYQARTEESLKYFLKSESNFGNYATYAKLDNPLVIDAKGANWNRIPLPESIWSELPSEKQNFYNGKLVSKTRAIAAYAKDNGYDGVIFKNLEDNGGYNDYVHHAKSDVYVVFDSAQVKSADPVTYDDNGNVVRLSERFIPELKDIRYRKRIDSQYDFSLDKDLNTLDDKALKVYNKRGWSYSLFSDEEMVLLREKFDEYYQLNTRNKDNVLPDGTMITDVNNKMLLIGGNRNSPVIHSVLYINADSELYADYIKRGIYDDAKEIGINSRQFTNYLASCEEGEGTQSVRFYSAEDYYHIRGREQERATAPDDFEDFGYVRDYEIGRRLREQAERTGKIKPQKRVNLDQDQDAQVQGGYSFNDFEVEFGEEIEDTLAREFETHHEDIGEVLRNTADIEITAAKVNSIVNRIIKNNLGEIDSKSRDLLSLELQIALEQVNRKDAEAVTNDIISAVRDAIENAMIVDELKNGKATEYLARLFRFTL